ncbi:DUF6653 family protein [Mesorhizobium sp. VNQ89]|uniref:DUF6653 family protein n=1 Tax=Mesorhizobium quangtriensis TaxID=3157709 RepID=UPI0032B7AE75
MTRFLGLTEKMMGMDDRAWERHVNPWSGWSRLSILPLFAVAVWSRHWIGWWAVVAIAAVLLWTWLNPRLFKPPASTENWMSKGVLGERIWLQRSGDPALAHHATVVRALIVTSSAGAIVMLIGLALTNLPLTISGLAVTMLSKLWLLDRMVWVYTEADTARTPR